MNRKRRSFKRPSGERRYRKIFVIAAEGFKTEPQYFALLNDLHTVIHVTCLKDKKASAPPQVLQRMMKYLREQDLRNSDESWLVVDKDSWTDAQLQELYKWSQTAKNYGFALSNPSFEYWLLLHFEDGAGISNARECSDHLKRYLPDYDKSINSRKITREMIQEAIIRASNRDSPRCDDWPHVIGTTVYRLVQNIFSKKNVDTHRLMHL
jgi:hypothetical protein